MKIVDLTGKTFSYLTVVKMAGSNRQGSKLWLCRCICGTEKNISSDHLTRKKSPVRSCGCKATLKGSDSPIWEGVGEISGNWWYNHVERERKQNTRVRIPIEITKQYAWELFLQQEKKCALSGVPIKIGQSIYGTASIDRIDSSKGYIPGNIQWVHKVVNFMKRTYSQEYFIDMCKKIADHQRSLENTISISSGNSCEIT